jgi:hypothetical protein
VARCLSLDICPSSIPLHVLEAYCSFPKRIGNTANQRRRFLLYYWYSVEIYAAFGFKNRVKLPICTASKIRELFPNDKKVKYTGHVDVDNAFGAP